MTNRPLSRGAQLLSEHQLAFGAGPEFPRPGYPDTFCEGPLRENCRRDLGVHVGDQSRIFVLSKSTLPHRKLYAAAILHNLICYAEGQSALNSCLRQGK